MDKKGEMVTLHQSVIVNNAKKVDWLRGELREEESACMVVNECKSHVPTLVCVVNAVGTLKKHFLQEGIKVWRSYLFIISYLFVISYCGALKTS